jgi:sterol desaturase/sphingolipid hydroxylase (fatty acid hydroxylase superfamily)
LIAAAVSGSRIGLLNKPWLPLIVRWIVAVLILDLAKYASHRALHSVGFLWRVHRVHHSDRDFDVSTSVRSHPLEVVLSQGATLATIALIAPPIGAVLAAQLISVFESFFSHANASLPERLREGLGLIYTPDTHRIHHAVDIGMQNRNFGDIFPWWDFLFGTYHPPRSASEDRLAIGLEEFQDGISPGVMSLLKEPFTGVTKE